jgi:hypothetical protein
MERSEIRDSIVSGWISPDCAALHPGYCSLHVIACDKREAFAQGSEATKQSMVQQAEAWIASLRSQ